MLPCSREPPGTGPQAAPSLSGTKELSLSPRPTLATIPLHATACPRAGMHICTQLVPSSPCLPFPPLCQNRSRQHLPDGPDLILSGWVHLPWRSPIPTAGTATRTPQTWGKSSEPKDLNFILTLPKSQEVPTPHVDVSGKDEEGESLCLCSPLAVSLLGPPPHGHAWGPPQLCLLQWNM